MNGFGHGVTSTAPLPPGNIAGDQSTSGDDGGDGDADDDVENKVEDGDEVVDLLNLHQKPGLNYTDFSQSSINNNKL